MKFSEKEIIIGIILIIIVIAFSVNIFWADPVNVSFCGDGKCADSEVGECKIDCDWCGDSYCQSNEGCSSCSDDCGLCGSSAFCGDGVCNLGECNSACWNDCSYLECEDGICDGEKGENCVNSPNDCSCSDGYCDSDSQQCVYQSCGNNNCESHESYLNCPNDCSGVAYSAEDNSNINYPIIFIHGHSPQESGSQYSINAFEKFQEKLETENRYSSKGILLPSAKKESMVGGEWGQSEKPVSIRTTYYLGVYDERGDNIGTEDEQSISVYADRLSNIVDVLKHYTGKKKVILVAHSMGGLVSREYIRKYGSGNIDSLITIGTPNHGIEGYLDWLCPIHSGPECDEMAGGSEFLTRLNSDESPGNTNYLTIAGDCCNDNGYRWDETVRVESVELSGAENIIVNGEGVSGLGTFHSELIDPSDVPEVYNKVVEFLR